MSAGAPFGGQVDRLHDDVSHANWKLGTKSLVRLLDLLEEMAQRIEKLERDQPKKGGV